MARYIMSEKELGHIRSEVISNFLEVERLVNVIITQHYFGMLYANFMMEVLYDPGCRFSFKLNILEKTGQVTEGTMLLLRRLYELKKIFSSDHFEFALDNEGEQQYVIVDGKTGNVLDYDVCYEEFSDIYPQIMNGLDDVLKDLEYTN